MTKEGLSAEAPVAENVTVHRRHLLMKRGPVHPAHSTTKMSLTTMKVFKAIAMKMVTPPSGRGAPMKTSEHQSRPHCWVQLAPMRQQQPRCTRWKQTK